MTTLPIIWLTIFVLAIFVGVEVISKVSATLHTPLMSGANAIHGVILIGAILVTGTAQSTPILVLGLVGVILASINMVGGFVVTDRMLIMFSRPRRELEKSVRRELDKDTSLGAAWLPGGRDLLHHCPQGVVLTEDRAPRQPDRRGRCGVGVRDRLSGFRRRSSAADLGCHRSRYGNRGYRRVPRPNDPDAATRGVVQRCGRWRGRNCSVHRAD